MEELILSTRKTFNKKNLVCLTVEPEAETEETNRNKDGDSHNFQRQKKRRRRQLKVSETVSISRDLKFFSLALSVSRLQNREQPAAGHDCQLCSIGAGNPRFSC